MTTLVRAQRPLRRAFALWALLSLAYAATLGLEAFPGSEYGGDEPHYLLAAKSIVEDGDIDVLDDFRAREYADFYPRDLEMHGVPRGGRLYEAHGAGFPYLLAPAFALGGATGVQLFLAVLAALAVALSYLLALRVTPDPWALGAALAVGLSPPFIAYGTAVYPELAAGAALAGAAIAALRLREHASAGATISCFGLLTALPWLGTKFVPAGVVIGFLAARTLWRQGEGRLLALGSLEVATLGVFAYVAINQSIYGGLTPYAADAPGETATEAELPFGYLERAYRLGALFVDREYGLLRWAPVFALGIAGAWLLHRSRRDGLSRIAPTRRDAEEVATLCALAIGAQLLVAAFLAPTMFGFWFPPRHLLAGLPLAVPLVAWGLRRLPRIGTALATIGLAGSLWLYLDVRLGDGSLVSERPEAPWGPLVDLFPFYGASPLPYALTAAVGAAVVAMLLWHGRDRHARFGHSAGARL